MKLLQTISHSQNKEQFQYCGAVLADLTCPELSAVDTIGTNITGVSKNHWLFQHKAIAVCPLPGFCRYCNILPRVFSFASSAPVHCLLHFWRSNETLVKHVLKDEGNWSSFTGVHTPSPASTGGRGLLWLLQFALGFDLHRLAISCSCRCIYSSKIWRKHSFY